MAAIDVGRTALLVMDYQRMILEGYTSDPAAYVRAGGEVIAKARSAGLKVIYVRVGFRVSYPEVSNNNAMFSPVRDAGMFLRGDSAFCIPAEIAPTHTDVVIEKHRVSCFEGTDLTIILRAGRIETLVMFGVATSGVVLSTVRSAADLDYKLIVLHDLCSDKDEEVHRVLVQKVLPSQATVITAGEFVAQL